MREKSRFHRRENYTGNPMLVNLPIKGYKSTGEGGLAFYFAVQDDWDSPQSRCCCIAGSIVWERPNVCVRPARYDKKCVVDMVMLIGSTGLSLWNDKAGHYFYATYSNLTTEGKALYNQLKKLYSKIDIVTLLDT